jgi:hypothetical protein
MNCLYCQQPIVSPGWEWECHAEQDFCSSECAMRFVYAEPIGKPVPHSLWSLNVLLGAKFEFAYKADDFAEEYFVGPVFVSNDVVNDWLLFLNHKQYGYIHLADLNRLASIIKLILNGDMQTAASWILADFLDSVGTVISRGHWVIGPINIYCDETHGWSWGMKTDVQHT